jgi:hypothetical protein
MQLLPFGLPLTTPDTLRNGAFSETSWVAMSRNSGLILARCFPLQVRHFPHNRTCVASRFRPRCRGKTVTSMKISALFTLGDLRPGADNRCVCGQVICGRSPLRPRGQGAAKYPICRWAAGGNGARTAAACDLA